MYKKAGLTYIEPELREDRGEIEAAKTGKLPILINFADIKGYLHCHTKATDVADTLENMIQATIKRGYQYIAIRDHSKHLPVAKGFGKEELLKRK